MKKNKTKKSNKYQGPVTFIEHDQLDTKIPSNWNTLGQFAPETTKPKQKKNKGKTGLV